MRYAGGFVKRLVSDDLDNIHAIDVIDGIVVKRDGVDGSDLVETGGMVTNNTLGEVDGGTVHLPRRAMPVVSAS